MPATIERAEKELTRATCAGDGVRRTLSTAEHAVTSIAAQLEALDGRRAELIAAVAALPDADAGRPALVAAETAAAAVNDARNAPARRSTRNRGAALAARLRRAHRDDRRRVPCAARPVAARASPAHRCPRVCSPPTGPSCTIGRWPRPANGGPRRRRSTPGVRSVNEEALALVASLAAPLAELGVAVVRWRVARRHARRSDRSRHRRPAPPRTTRRVADQRGAAGRAALDTASPTRGRAGDCATTCAPRTSRRGCSPVRSTRRGPRHRSAARARRAAATSWCSVRATTSRWSTATTRASGGRYAASRAARPSRRRSHWHWRSRNRWPSCRRRGPRASSRSSSTRASARSTLTRSSSSPAR